MYYQPQIAAGKCPIRDLAARQFLEREGGAESLGAGLLTCFVVQPAERLGFDDSWVQLPSLAYREECGDDSIDLGGCRQVQP